MLFVKQNQMTKSAIQASVGFHTSGIYCIWQHISGACQVLRRHVHLPLCGTDCGMSLQRHWVSSALFLSKYPQAHPSKMASLLPT